MATSSIPVRRGFVGPITEPSSHGGPTGYDEAVVVDDDEHPRTEFLATRLRDVFKDLGLDTDLVHSVSAWRNGIVSLKLTPQQAEQLLRVLEDLVDERPDPLIEPGPHQLSFFDD